MKMTKGKIAVLVLLAVTVIYAVMFYQSLQVYKRSPSDFPSFLASNVGRPYLMPTIWLMLIWIFGIPFIVTKKWKSQLAALFLAATITIPTFIVVSQA